MRPRWTSCTSASSPRPPRSPSSPRNTPTVPSKSNGGVIGRIARGQTVAPFEEAAFSTPVGGVSKATTTFGVHIIQVLDARDAAPAPVDVTVTDLAEVLEGADLDDVNLIDAREQDEWDTANIPQFTLKPLSQIRLWAPAATEEFDPSKPTYVVRGGRAVSQRQPRPHRPGIRRGVQRAGRHQRRRARGNGQRMNTGGRDRRLGATRERGGQRARTDRTSGEAPYQTRELLR